MRYYKKIALVFVLGFAMSSTFASTAGNAQNGEKIYKNGKGDVPACNSCHGETALGDDNMGTPVLAGQGYTYILKQLNDFASDKRMDTTMYIMNSNAKGLTEQDRLDVATYVTHLPVTVDQSKSDMKAVADIGTTPVGKRYLGKSLAQFGAPDRGIPACHSCHGYNGRGAFPMYPVLGGQKYVYLVNQLKKWRDASRNNDFMKQMTTVAKNLTDDDIYNVATFLTSAPVTTIGNARVPARH